MNHEGRDGEPGKVSGFEPSILIEAAVSDPLKKKKPCLEVKSIEGTHR